MQAAYLVVGTVLIIMSGLFLAGALALSGETCGTTAAASASLSIPSCDSILATIVGLVIVAVILFSVAGLVLFLGRGQAVPAMPVQSPILQPPQAVPAGQT